MEREGRGLLSGFVGLPRRGAGASQVGSLSRGQSQATEPGRPGWAQGAAVAVKGTASLATVAARPARLPAALPAPWARQPDGCRPAPALA